MYEDDEGIRVSRIADQSVRARKRHDCAGFCSGIVPGEVYRRICELVDGDICVTKICFYCEHGEDRRDHERV